MTHEPWSARVRPVGAAAIQVAAQRLLHVRLSDDQALGLTVFGSVSRAVSELKERLRIQRQVPGVTIDEQGQVALAVAEVVAVRGAPRSNGKAEAQRIIDVVGAVAGARGGVEHTNRDYGAIKELEAALEKRGKRFRRFVRALARQRSELLNRVRSHMLDDTRTEAAVRELDAHFAECLSRAIRIDETSAE